MTGNYILVHEADKRKVTAEAKHHKRTRMSIRDVIGMVWS